MGIALVTSVPAGVVRCLWRLAIFGMQVRATFRAP